MRALLLGLGMALAVAGVASAQQQDGSSMINRLHDDLRLTAEQEPAWRQYQSAMQDTAGSQARRESTQRMLPQLQTPRRLALIEAAMSQDLSDFRRQSQAVVAFYDRLTPAQQRTFDRELTPGSQGQGPGPGQ